MHGMPFGTAAGSWGNAPRQLRRDDAPAALAQAFCCWPNESPNVRGARNSAACSAGLSPPSAAATQPPAATTGRAQALVLLQESRTPSAPRKPLQQSVAFPNSAETPPTRHPDSLENSLHLPEGTTSVSTL